MTIFLGVSEKLEDLTWNEADPRVFLQRPDREQANVISNFSKPFVYQVGTARDCRCKEKPGAETGYLTEMHKRSVYQIVRSQIMQGHDVELYCCKAGDYKAPVEQKLLAVLEQSFDHFYIAERELVVFKARLF